MPYQLRQAFFIFLTMLYTNPSFAGIHFTLQSSLSQNNLALSSQHSRSASVSVATDIGTYFRLGITHRQSINKSAGYYRENDTNTYFYKQEQYHTFANSVDFTIILYYGRIFVPFLTIGMVKKDYLVVSSQGENPTVKSAVSIPPVPNGGIGLGIRLNRNFSLKLSYSVSPGVRQAHPDLEPESVLDSYTSVGITYNI